MYKRNERRWLKHADFIVADMISLIAAFVLSYFFYFHQLAFIKIRPYSDSFVVLFLANLSIIFLTESYRNVLKKNNLKEFGDAFSHLILLIAVHLMWLFMTGQSYRYSRALLISTYILYFVLSYLICHLLKWLIVNQKIRKPKKRMLIVSSEDKAEESIKKMVASNYSNYEIIGIGLLEQSNTRKIAGYPVIECGMDIVDYVTTHWLDEVFVENDGDPDLLYEIISGLVETGVTIHISLQNHECLEGTEQFIEKVGSEYVITSTMKSFTNFQLLEKRILDIIGGLIGSFITVLLMLTAGMMIKIKDPGPMFYTYERVGTNGKTFKMIKFRSMVMNADKMKEQLMKEQGYDGLMFKMEHDPRIIGGENGIGEFLRKTSLDEFPQFFNVLLGQMSIVGTRPPTLDEGVRYEPHHRARVSTKPGITGMWQVSGRSDIKDFDEVVRLDREYIENWSILEDIKIILKTIKVVLKKEGSY